METQKILNLLKSSENEYLKFATKKWYVIDSETGTYSENEPIKFLTRSIESSLCVIIMMHIFWSQEIFLLEVIIQKRHFKIASPLENAEQINETFVDEGQRVNIAMSTYNLIEYSDNYSDTSGSSWHFNRDEQPKENGELSDLSADNSTSFKYK